MARVLPFDGNWIRPAVQAGWAATPVRRRVAVVRRLRPLIAEHAGRLADAVRLPQRGSRAETLAAEVLPLADACRFLEREATALLAPRQLGRRGRPFWLRGSRVEVRREPLGTVLVIGPGNYPLLLPGVQTVQALVAGNAVQLKPGRGGAEAAALLAELLRSAGLPEGLLAVLDETPQAAVAAIEAGVDKVVLTGSLATGRAVLRRLAGSVTPAVVELSGCDAAFVRADADLDLAARALAYGFTFNAGFTCIAPRRVLVDRARQPELERRLAELLAGAPPLAIGEDVAARIRRLTSAALDAGARIVCGLDDRPADAAMRPLVLADVRPPMAILDADLAAPVASLVTVDGDGEALEIARRGRYRLGATIFGGEAAARALAAEIPAGVVVINDAVAPTADPRAPFGGRGASGFGVTRGAEGLLELTQVKTVIARRGRFRPHLDPAGPDDERLMGELVQSAHARSLLRRLRAAFEIVRLSALRGQRGK